MAPILLSLIPTIILPVASDVTTDGPLPLILCCSLAVVSSNNLIYVFPFVVVPFVFVPLAPT